MSYDYEITYAVCIQCPRMCARHLSVEKDREGRLSVENRNICSEFLLSVITFDLIIHHVDLATSLETSRGRVTSASLML